MALSTSTTVTHSGNMVTVETSSKGVPNLVVDFMKFLHEVFLKQISVTILQFQLLAMVTTILS